MLSKIQGLNKKGIQTMSKELNHTEMAAKLGIHRHTLRNQVKAGKIKPIRKTKTGRCYYSLEDLSTESTLQLILRALEKLVEQQKNPTQE